MKFIMNGIEYIIREVEQEEMWKESHKEMNLEEGWYFGKTLFYKDEIWLDKSLSKAKKRKTLMHELMHCYIKCFFAHNEMNFDEEALCDISANAHDIINDIVEKYFKEKVNDKNKDSKK